jgi:peptidoglycan/xylan/chitin deacetylase (PgdA/CDA1 family)
MFEMTPLGGSSLPDRTLVLTLDDGPGETVLPGPGPRTLPLAEYLADAGVQATFFQCGKHLAELPWMPERLRALGHTVANHSYSHPRLTTISFEEVVVELETTHQLLGQATGQATFFRAPYGDITPEHCRVLNAQLPQAADYVGPIDWDIDVDDWSFWQRGLSARACADAFVAEADRVGRGIVLMHDSTADMPDVKLANQAFATIQLVVPELKAKGYEFVPLQAVPDIAARLVP